MWSCFNSKSWHLHLYKSTFFNNEFKYLNSSIKESPNLYKKLSINLTSFQHTYQHQNNHSTKTPPSRNCQKSSHSKSHQFMATARNKSCKNISKTSKTLSKSTKSWTYISSIKYWEKSLTIQKFSLRNTWFREFLDTRIKKRIRCLHIT